jgi:hypothetical protein
MFALQDTREAQQMWERKFNNAGREGIVLSDGKRKGLFRSVVKNNESKVTQTGIDSKLVVSQSGA